MCAGSSALPGIVLLAITGFLCENSSMLSDLKSLDWKVVLVIFYSTTAILVDRYHSFFSVKAFDRIVLYLVIPLLFILVLFRQQPSEYGFRLGDWRTGLRLTLIGCAAVTVVLYFVARTEAFQAYYAGWGGSTLPLGLHLALDLLGWEFIFRGLLLFALLPVCGPYAIFIQAIPFAIAHIGKPELETLSCILGGSLFGLVAWRTRSFLYPFAIHWYLMMITVYFTR